MEPVKKTAQQVYAALGIGFVCVVLGLPLWWKTTTVYRVSLPYADIMEYARRPLEYKMTLEIVTLESDGMGRNVINELATLYDMYGSGTQPKPDYKWSTRQAYKEELNVFDSTTDIEQTDDTLFKSGLLDNGDKYTVYIMPKTRKMKTTMGRYTATYVSSGDGLKTAATDIYRTLVSLMAGEAELHRVYASTAGAAHSVTDKASMRRVRTQPGYQVTFTLLNPQPDLTDARWNIQEALRDYMGAFLEKLREHTNINVKSQYIFFTGIGIRPHKDTDGNHYLNEDDLPHIINPVESSLASHVSTHPTLNFVLYIPSRDQFPLHIRDSAGRPAVPPAFLSPRWGGILVCNDAPTNISTTPASLHVDMRVVMETFMSQLRMLLGLHVTPVKDVVSETPLDVALPPGGAGVTEWELRRWLRMRTVENVAAARQTLVSLAQLLEKISNIVIRDEIGQEVDRAVRAIARTMTSLHKGELRAAYEASVTANMAAEKAFFDPSLLELLYFPEDQKFAIYIPLFLPIGIPIAMSLLQAVKWFKDRRKEKTD